MSPDFCEHYDRTGMVGKTHLLGSGFSSCPVRDVPYDGDFLTFVEIEYRCGVCDETAVLGCVWISRSHGNSGDALSQTFSEAYVDSVIRQLDQAKAEAGGAQ